MIDQNDAPWTVYCYACALYMHMFPSSMPYMVYTCTAGLHFSASSEPAGEEREQAIAALLPYLLSHRSRLAALQTHSSASTASVQGNTPRAGLQQPLSEELDTSTTCIPAELWPAAAAAIDTAIAKVSMSFMLYPYACSEAV